MAAGDVSSRDADGVVLDVDVAPVLSSPLAHNHLPVVSSISLRLVPADGSVPATLAGVVVQVEVRDVEGRVGAPWERVVDLPPGTTVLLDDVGLRLDPVAMLQITDERPGTVVVQVHRDGRLLAERDVPVLLLGSRQWLASPRVLALELLPAFITPQDPVVARLAAQVLAGSFPVTARGAETTPGAARGAGAVPDGDGVVDGAVQAVRGLGLRRVEQTRTDHGQVVRTSADLVDGNAGSDLDLTLLLAAVLERLGVPALIWVTTDGAFLGYWRTDAALAPVAQTEVGEVLNLVDLGAIGLVAPSDLLAPGEGAGAGAGATQRDRTGSDRTAAVRARLLTGAALAEVIGVVDVRRARQAGVRALPVAVPQPDADEPAEGLVDAEHGPAAGTVIGTDVAADQPDQPDPPAPEPAPQAETDEVPARVRRWKTSLLDLSLRNRLLSFTPRGAVALAVAPGTLGAVEDALHDHEALTLLPADQLDEVTVARGTRTGADLLGEARAELFERRRALFTDLPTAVYPARLRALAYRARTVIEETGANNLYLALGTLVWSLDGRDLRSPLVLVPVRLVALGQAGEYRVEIDEAGVSTPNLSLLEKLHQVFGMQVPGLATPTEDAAGIDVDSALLSVRAAIAGRGLPFHVEESAHLAVLQFAKIRLWKDLEDSWPEMLANPLVSHLVHTPTLDFDDPVPSPEGVDLDELDATCVLPADASQLDAVAQAVAGRSFVLEGPPGTGKSQTIANLLVSAVAEGRRVLFVAEKRAALDVVQSRLDAVGMGPLTLDLHDAGSRPSAVRAQLREALDHRVEVDDQGLGADLEQLTTARDTLARYAARLHEQNGAGFSFYSARTGLLALGDAGPAAPTLPVPLDLLSAAGGARLLEVRRLLATLPDVADPARPGPDNPWGFVGLADPARLDAAGVRRAVDAVDDALRDFAGLVGAGRPGTLADPLGAARSHEDLGVLAAFADAAAGDPLTGEITLCAELAVLDASRTDRWREAAATLLAEVDAFAATAHPGTDVLRPDALDLPVADLHRRATEAARGGLLGRTRRLEAVLLDLQPGLHPGATVKPKQVPGLTRDLVALQGAVGALAARVVMVRGLSVPPGWNPLTPAGRDALRTQAEWVVRAGELVDPDGPDPRRDAFVAALRRYLEAPDAGVRAPQVAESVERAAQTTADLARVVRAEAGQVSRWAGDRGFVARWATTAEGRAEGEESTLGLRRWVTFVGALELVRRAGMGEARELLLSGAVHAEDAVRALDRGVAAASGRERRATTGLDAFDPMAHDRAVERFRAATDAVREHLRTAIPAEVLAARRAHHHDLAPDAAAQEEVQEALQEERLLGALRRELARQRGGKGVRALMSAYGDLITRLTPCVLVSPDSLARFLPVRAGMFDLVVFDEASQIRVADAVGAMGRARSVVVVGDSKQLPPTTFAEPADGEQVEPVAAAVEDEESILSECVQAGVPRRWLGWHYRSQDESLIAFSNQHYYEGRLSSFPAPTDGPRDVHPGATGPDVHGRGISLVRVDGHFHRTAPDGDASLLRTNPVEAQAVVAEVVRRFAADASAVPSIGVVTLNAPQRALVETLLRDATDERIGQALDAAPGTGEGLFVKNLENVQGDERDVVLLSTAFSADSSGRLPLNFGPLNREGGERRLNVAVTRARRQVVVFSSFDPEQLRAHETTSIGVRHLRAYLDLAATGSAPRVEKQRVEKQRVEAQRVEAQREGATRLRPAAVDRHREQVAEGLRTRGLVVRTDVGLSDFRIDLVVSLPDDPERALLAVLLDGPAWAARRTVTDRDGLPAQVLTHTLRWPAVERVWLPAWLSAPGAVLDHLEEVTRLTRRTLAAGHAGQMGEPSPIG